MSANPYEEVFCALEAIDDYLKLSGSNPFSPEFADIWAELVSKFEDAKEHAAAERIIEAVRRF